MTKRKLLALLLALLMCFSVLISCNNNPDSDPKPGTDPNPGTDPEPDNRPAYTVTFDVNSGDSVTIPSQSIKEGDCATPPTQTLTKSGHYFSGWYKDTAATQSFSFSTPITANITLYAGWTELVADYESTLAEWSQSDHIYFHYKRFANSQADYQEWNMWVWPEIEGSNGVAIEWTKFDQSGAIAELDLTKTFTNGGTTGDKTVTFAEADTLGFLIVLKSSKAAGGHWQSDGGDVKQVKFRENKREDGSIHLFMVQGSASDYTFEYDSSTEEIVDPYEGIEPGSAVSKNNVDSSKIKYIKPKTSQEFYKNVGVGYTIQVVSFKDSDGDGWGDIKGITQSLDYLKDLNAQVLWLTPVQAAETYHGYDVVDYYAINPRFGTIEDYRQLVYEAHKRGIKIVMDLVVNHTSINNTWFKKSTRLEKETLSDGTVIDYRSFYNWKYGDSYATQDRFYQYSNYGYYYYSSFASNMPELNYDYQGTRDAMVDVALYWMSFGLDGFRIDATKHIYMEGEYSSSSTGDVIYTQDKGYERNVTKNINFMRELNTRVKAVYPDAFIVGENFDGNENNIAPYYETIDSQFSFNTYYNLARAVAGRGGAGFYFAQSFEYNLGLYNAARGGTAGYMAIESSISSNHDITRLANHMVADDPSDSASNYNSLISVTAANKDAVKSKSLAYMGAIMTMPGVSWIYYGDEIGLSGAKFRNPDGSDNHADRWLRQPMLWTSWTDTTSAEYQTLATVNGQIELDGYIIGVDDFNKTLPGVKQQLGDNSSMLKQVMAMTDMKANDPVLIYGSYAQLSTGNNNVMSFTRTLNGTTYRVYHNFGASNFNPGGGTVVYKSQGASATYVPQYGFVVIKA